MGIPSESSLPAQYTVVPLIGPDGAGKTSLLHAIGGYVQRRDGLPAPPLRSVRDATVLDRRTPRGFFQHVDFANGAVEEAALGATPFQGALLVVGAADSVLEGTVRSIGHAHLAGIPRVVAALTKCDVVEDPEMLDLVEMEVRELLTKYGYAGERGDVPVGRIAAFPGVQEDARWSTSLAQFCDAAQGWFG